MKPTGNRDAQSSLLTGKLVCCWLATAICCAWLTGCGTFGGAGKQAAELRLENDRLLSEFRAQRDRLTALQETNAALEARLNESEKLLAQLGQSSPTARLSRAETPASRGSAGQSLPTHSSSRNSAAASRGAIGTNPSMGTGAIPGNGVGGSATNPTSSDGLQWRPMRRQ